MSSYHVYNKYYGTVDYFRVCYRFGTYRQVRCHLRNRPIHSKSDPIYVQLTLF